MSNYYILDNPNKGIATTERPDVVGTKRTLKKKHGGIHGMVSEYLRFMVSQWNTQYNTPIETFNDNRKVMVKNSPVDEIRLNYQFYQAQQENYPYAYLTEWQEGKELPSPWSNGHEIFQTVQHMVGPVVKHFVGTTITVESLDPSVQSIKQGKIAMLEAKKKLPEIFKRFAEMGANFMPEGEAGTDMDVAIQEAIRKPSHKIEKFGMDLLNFINNVNSVKETMPRRYRDVVIGRYCGTHVDSSSSRINLEGIRPEDLMWDRSDEDDDFNRYSLFKGFLSWKTKEEIVQAYNLTSKDVLEELDNMFSKNTSSATTTLAAISRNEQPDEGFAWVESGKVRRMACVTGYFVASVYNKGDDEGFYNTLYRGTLIGDTILVDYGEANNIVYDMAKPEYPIIPIFIYSPDTVLGRNVSPVDRFRQAQSDCDAFLNRVRERISKDLGKVPIIWAESLGGDAVTAKTLVEDFKRDGITVLKRGDGEEPIVNGKPVEVLDLSLDPNIKVYMELRKEMFQDMRDVVSQSRITTGMQQTYIGGGTQQATISQANNGTVGIMQGFFQHFAHIEHYILNAAKTMLLDAKNADEAELIFSKASREFWKAIKEVNVEDLQVRVEMEDFIDDELRAELNTMALAWAQNFKETGFGPIEWLDSKTARTVTELQRKMKETFELKEMKRERERKEDMAFQQQQQERQIQAQQEQDAANNQASAQRDMIREAPEHEKNQIKREELNMQRNVDMGSEAGMPSSNPLI